MIGTYRNGDGYRQLTIRQRREQRYRSRQGTPGVFVTREPVGHVAGEHYIVELAVHQACIAAAHTHDIEVPG
jgi:hypothetical protein